jgi:transposase
VASVVAAGRADLTDAQWAVLESVLHAVVPKGKKPGRRTRRAAAFAPVSSTPTAATGGVGREVCACRTVSASPVGCQKSAHRV